MSVALHRVALLAVVLAIALCTTVAREGTVRAADLRPPETAAATTTCANAVAGAGAQHAGLVIDFGGGRTQSLCLEFSGDDISGAELLRSAGMDVVFSGFGGGLGSAVCRIDDVGCSDPGECFCQCRGSDCNYWSYWSFDGSAWHYENLGPSHRRLHNGDVDGWVWGPPSRSGGPLQGVAGPCPATATPTSPRPAPSPAGRTAVPPAATEPASAGGAIPTPARVQPGTATADGATLETASPRAGTPTPRAQVLGGSQDGGSAQPGAAAVEHDGGGGLPVGIIAFAVVALTVVVAGGGIVVWRRAGG